MRNTHHHPTVALILALIISCGNLLGSIAPTAQAREREQTLLRAGFAGSSLGPITTEQPTRIGTIFPAGGTVAIANLDNKPLLTVGSAAISSTALLRWSNYPGGLPMTPPPALQLRIKATLIAPALGAGGTFGLLAGTTIFEIVTFGPNGELIRAGSNLGVTYAANEPVEVEGFIRLPAGASSGKIQIKISSRSKQRTFNVDLPAGVNATTLNQLRLHVPAGAVAIFLKQAEVTLKAEEREDDDPPAVVSFDDNDIEHDQETINGIVFINIRITISNTGGKARDCFLIIDLNDLQDFDLAEVGFLEGEGFVSEIRDGKVYIGIGLNNILRNDNIKVKVKFKLKEKHGEVRTNVKMWLSFRDTSGPREIVLIPIPILILLPIPGAGTTPIDSTTPISGTTPVSDVARLPLAHIDTRLVRFWQTLGGIRIFGLPISDPITLPNGLIVQYFERARLEYDPQRRIITIGRLAVELGHQEPSEAPPNNATDLRWYFPATGHLIAVPFRNTWQSRGGVIVFGYPIGNTHEVDGARIQYFERARLEFRNGKVEIGLIGVARFGRQ